MVRLNMVSQPSNQSMVLQDITEAGHYTLSFTAQESTVRMRYISNEANGPVRTFYMDNAQLVESGSEALATDLLSSMDYYPFGMPMPMRWHNHEPEAEATFKTISNQTLTYYSNKNKEEPTSTGEFGFTNANLNSYWVGKGADYSGSLPLSGLYSGSGTTSHHTYTTTSGGGILSLTSGNDQLFLLAPTSHGNKTMALFRDIGAGSTFELDSIDTDDRLELTVNVAQVGSLQDNVQVSLLDQNFNVIKTAYASNLQPNQFGSVTLVVENSDVVAASGVGWDENHTYYVMIGTNLHSASYFNTNGVSATLIVSNWNLTYKKQRQSTQSNVDANTFVYQPYYRYGFNGMERDDEVKGVGNSYDFGARIYDPRVARWSSMDPIGRLFAGQTFYGYSQNNPLFHKDIDGKVISGATTSDLFAIYESIISIYGDNDVVKKLFQHESGTNSFAEISEEDFQNALGTLQNEAKRALLKGYYEAITSDIEYTLSIVGTDENADPNLFTENCSSCRYTEFALGRKTFDGTTTGGKLLEYNHGAVGFKRDDGGALILFNKEYFDKGRAKPRTADGAMAAAILKHFFQLDPFILDNESGYSYDQNDLRLTGFQLENLVYRSKGNQTLGGQEYQWGTLFKVETLTKQQQDKVRQTPIQLKVGGKLGQSNRGKVSGKYGHPRWLCFVQGTQIIMADGKRKNIEDVSVGDKVLSVNLKTMQIEADTVIKIDSPFHDDIVEIKFSDGTINRNTFDHPYYVKDKGWCSYRPDLTNERYGLQAKPLVLGDSFYRFDNGKLSEVVLVGLSEKRGEVKTYNLTGLKRNNNYFANGILVNNESHIILE